MQVADELLDMLLAPLVDGDQWVPRLVRGNIVWLVKERAAAEISRPFAADSGAAFGTLYLIRYSMQVFPARWYVSRTGRGFDGSQLLLPIRGNLAPTTHAPDVIAERMRALTHEVARLALQTRDIEELVRRHQAAASVAPGERGERQIFFDPRLIYLNTLDVEAPDTGDTS